MSAEPLISVVVPVYNEGDNIATCLSTLSAALAGTPHEILVCYDFDEDTTLAGIARMPVRPPEVRLVKNTLGRGAAFAIRAGLAAGRGDVLVVSMADLSDDPKVIKEMAAKVRAGAAVVAGSRYMPGGAQEGGPLIKRTLSRVAGISLRWLTGVGTHDCTNSFRAFSRAYVDRVTIESTKGFDISLELTVKALLMDLPVDQVPSVWRDRTAGESRFQLWRWLPLYVKWYALGVLTDHLPDRARARSPWLFAALWAVLWMAFCEFPRTIAGTGLDLNWPLVLADGFARRWATGVDTVFTYGPFGWIHGAAYVPALFYRGIAIELASKCLLALWVARAAWALPPVRGAVFAALALLVAREDAQLWLAFLLGWQALRDRPERPAWRQAIALVLLAYLALVKGTFLLAGAGALALVAVQSRRSLVGRLGLVAGWLAALAALWRSAGGRFDQAWTWLTLTLEVVRGYAAGMGTSDRPVVEIAVAAALTLILAVAARRRLTLLDALVGCAVLKQAFVRHDVYHAGCFWTWLVLWTTLAGAVPRPVRLTLVAAGLAMLVTLRDLPDMARAPWSNARYLTSVRACRAGLEAQRALYAKAHALPELTARIGAGTVDILPASQEAVLLLNGLDYRPRPVFSYQALTPALLDANLAHLRSERAPAFLVLRTDLIDERHPDADDAPARAEVARAYEHVASEAGYELVARRATPAAPLERRVLVTRTLRFGETLELPATPVWLSARIALSAAGHAAVLLLKGPPVFLDLGAAGRFRVVPATAEVGFPIRGPSLRFDTAAPWAYDPVINVTLSTTR